ncbi:hypothetical protein ACFL2T_05235 [Elusimicrobiota bacterium]
MRKNSAFTAVFAGCLLAWPVFAGERERDRDEAAGPPQAISGDFIELMRNKLRLDDKQRKKVKAIADEANAKTERKLAEMRKLKKQLETLEKGINKEKREAFEKIRSELSYEQRETFDELRLRHRGGERHRRRIRIRRRDDGGEEREIEMFMGEDDDPRAPRGRMLMGPPEKWEGDGAPGKHRWRERKERREHEERMERRRGRGERSDDDREYEEREIRIEVEDDD